MSSPQCRVPGKGRKLMKRRQRGGPCNLKAEEECGAAEFQEELQRRLCSPAGSMSWLPRRVFIRLQGGTRKKRERAEIRARRQRRREEWPHRGPELQKVKKENTDTEGVCKVCVTDSSNFMFCTTDSVQKMALYKHRSQHLSSGEYLAEVKKWSGKKRPETFAANKTFYFNGWRKHCRSCKLQKKAKSYEDFKKIHNNKKTCMIAK